MHILIRYQNVKDLLVYFDYQNLNPLCSRHHCVSQSSCLFSTAIELLKSRLFYPPLVIKFFFFCMTIRALSIERQSQGHFWWQEPCLNVYDCRNQFCLAQDFIGYCLEDNYSGELRPGSLYILRGGGWSKIREMETISKMTI